MNNVYIARQTRTLSDFIVFYIHVSETKRGRWDYLMKFYVWPKQGIHSIIEIIPK